MFYRVLNSASIESGKIQTHLRCLLLRETPYVESSGWGIVMTLTERKVGNLRDPNSLQIGEFS